MVSVSPCPSFTASPCSRGGRQIALLTSLLFSTTLSFSDPLPTVVEGMPPTYRKVTLSGRPLASSMPQNLPDSDSEPEQTFIDPLTLRLQNRTTEIYIPIGDAELAITVNRNIEGSAWREDEGIPPAMRPDLPFGNCWSSGLAANVRLVDRGDQFPLEAVVTDEEGTIHRFVSSSREGRFISLPNSFSQQDFARLSLTREDSGEFVLTRKFGNKVRYFAEPSVVLETTLNGVDERHTYYRMDQFEDRFGATIRHIYHASNNGLIPDKIAYRKQVVTFIRNELGCVSRIIDPAGNSRLYHYQSPTQPGGAPLIVRLQKQITGSFRDEVTYDYDETSAKDKDGKQTHYCNISGITAREINHYKFTYSLENPSANDLPGRQLESVTLPGDFGTVRFHRLPEATLDSGARVRRTFVADAEGNGTLYEFSGCGIESIQQDEAVLARIAFHESQSFTHFEGNKFKIDRKTNQVVPSGATEILGTESMRFLHEAGGSLCEAVDTNGNTIRFTYDDAFPETLLGESVTHPFSNLCNDPSAWETPLKEKTTYEYSEKFRLPVKTTDSLGRITVMERTGPREVVASERVYASKKDFKSNTPFSVTESKYEDADHPGFETRNIVRVTSATPEEVSWEVDLVESYTLDRLGRLKNLFYDPDGTNYKIAFVYDRNSNTRSKIYDNGFRIDFKYDGVNQLTGVFKPSGGLRKETTKYIFGTRGKEVVFESDGTVEKYAYDRMGRQVEVISFDAGDYPDNPSNTEKSTFNSTGSEIIGKDESGFNYEVTRDGLQRTLLIKYDDDTSIHYTYENSVGSNLFQSSNYKESSKNYSDDKFITYYEYDANDRRTLTVEKSKTGKRELSRKTFVYDAVGNLIEVTEKGKGTTRHTYDALNRKIKTTYPSGKISRTLYTSTGLQYATIDANGKRTDTEYDSLGDPVE